MLPRDIKAVILFFAIAGLLPALFSGYLGDIAFVIIVSGAIWVFAQIA